jgi:hypothetical protein
MSVTHRLPKMKVSPLLSEEENNEINSFLNKLDNPSHFNSPYWAEIVEAYKKPIFIRFYENGALSGFVIAYTRMSLCIAHFPAIENKNLVAARI